MYAALVSLSFVRLRGDNGCESALQNVVIHRVRHCYLEVDSGCCCFERVENQHECLPCRLCHAGLFCEGLCLCGWPVDVTDS